MLITKAIRDIAIASSIPMNMEKTSSVHSTSGFRRIREAWLKICEDQAITTVITKVRRSRRSFLKYQWTALPDKVTQTPIIIRYMPCSMNAPIRLGSKLNHPSRVTGGPFASAVADASFIPKKTPMIMVLSCVFMFELGEVPKQFFLSLSKVDGCSNVNNDVLISTSGLGWFRDGP